VFTVSPWTLQLLPLEAQQQVMRQEGCCIHKITAFIVHLCCFAGMVWWERRMRGRFEQQVRVNDSADRPASNRYAALAAIPPTYLST
jgi:hypothetical protein